jgi:hypothetical protein
VKRQRKSKPKSAPSSSRQAKRPRAKKEKKPSARLVRRRDSEDFDNWYRRAFGRPFRPNQPSRQWPPNYPPNLSQKAVDRINWVIGEAERALKEACDGLPQSDPAGHDRQLEYLLIDFASLIYRAFLDEAKEELRSGKWTIGKHDSQDFSVIAGLFIRDIGEGAFHKFRALAASPENKVEEKAYIFAHSELVFAVLNSIQPRQKSPELILAARNHLFGTNEGKLGDSEKLRNDIAKEAGIVDSQKPARIGNLEKLKEKGFLSQKQAASEFECGERNIRIMVKQKKKKLTRTPKKGRILVDEKFCNEYKARYQAPPN